jgi:hypothetical protein
VRALQTGTQMRRQQRRQLPSKNVDLGSETMSRRSATAKAMLCPRLNQRDFGNLVSRSDLVAYGVKDHKYYGQAGFGCEPDRSI